MQETAPCNSMTVSYEPGRWCARPIDRSWEHLTTSDEFKLFDNVVYFPRETKDTHYTNVLRPLGFSKGKDGINMRQVILK